MKRIWQGITTLIALLLLSTVALAQVGQSYDLSWNSLETGETSSGGVYSLEGTAGAPATEALSGGSYSMQSGFVVDVCRATNQLMASGEIATNKMRLSWDSLTDSTGYDVYRSENEPYFVPTAVFEANISSPWDDLSGTAVGDATRHHFYVIRAHGDCGILSDSLRIGEFDFEIEPGS
ncbi:MAG: hypothetical protein AAF614_04760 [Chloroflexota bacterium]